MSVPPELPVQTIVFTSTAPQDAIAGGRAYVVSAIAGSGLSVVFTADPADAGVCIVTGSTVTPIGAGTCTIDANQPGDARYRAAPQVQQSFSVRSGAPSQSVQSINLTSTAPAGATVGGPTYTVAATASSGLPVTFSTSPGSASACTLTNGVVSFVGPGTCRIYADQAGDDSYLPAAQVQQSLTVALATQTITFASTPPAHAGVGDPAYVVAASASSGLPVVFSAEASSAGVCTVSGSSVAPVGAGTCIIDANQFGNSTYQAAVVQQSFAVAAGAPSRSVQSIQLSSTPPSGATVGGPTYTASATASSGLSVVFSADATSAGVCTVSGSTASFVGLGTCTLDANQAGDANYLTAPQVQQSFSVGLASQAISFTSTPPASALVGDPAYTVSATATSGLAVTFAAAPSSAGICTVSGATVTIVGSGTCTINANQAGNGSYQAATQVQQSFAISAPSASTQSINFTSTAPAGESVGGPTYTVAATASSGLPVAFTIAAGSAGICTISGSTVTLTGAGTCTINANQAGNGSYQAATQVQQAFTVSAASASTQSISFTSTAPAGATVGGPTYTATATASSGLPVTFTIAAGSAGICTSSGSTVTMTGAGTCTINANQAGNASYQPAPQVQQSFTVNLHPQTISFTSTPPGGAVVGGPTYTVSATATSGLPVTFTIAVASSGVCTRSGSVVSFTGTGTCTINANQAGNGSYQAATQVQQAFAVGNAPPSQSSQTIAFTSTAPAGAVVGGPTYTVAATASSGLSVAFTIAAGSAGICTISGSTVTLTGAGTCTINANQAGNASYLAAPQVQQSFTVNLHAQTVSFTSTPPGSAVVGDPTYTVSATASSGLAVTFTIASASAGVCALSGSTVTFTGAGTCTINANQAGNGSYQAAAQVQQTFTVGHGQQTITITSTPPNADKNDPPYTITATASSGLTVVFTTDPSSDGICSVAGSTVSFSGRGNCIIYANQAGDANWLPAPQVQQVFRIKNHTPG